MLANLRSDMHKALKVRRTRPCARMMDLTDPLMESNSETDSGEDNRACTGLSCS
jgi:hypothetical protein